MVTALPITASAFAPFGQLITAPDEVGGRSPTGGLSFDPNRPVVLSTTHARRVEEPVVVRELERHPHSSQTFLPLEVRRWIVIVWLTCDAKGVKAFEVGPGRGVTIARGVWHHGLTVLDDDARFAVLMWKDGRTDDEFRPIDAIEVSCPAR